MINNKRIDKLKKKAEDIGLITKDLTEKEIEAEINRLENSLGITALREENKELRSKLEGVLNDK